MATVAECAYNKYFNRLLPQMMRCKMCSCPLTECGNSECDGCCFMCQEILDVVGPSTTDTCWPCYRSSCPQRTRCDMCSCSLAKCGGNRCDGSCFVCVELMAATPKIVDMCLPCWAAKYPDSFSDLIWPTRENNMVKEK